MPGGCWLYETPQGVFRIELNEVGRRGCFTVFLERDLLGCYETATTALKRLIQGETQKPRCGLDILRLGLPPSLISWTFCPAGVENHSSEIPDLHTRPVPGVGSGKHNEGARA